MAATAEQNLGSTFEERNHIAMRRSEMAPALGHIGVGGARADRTRGLESRRQDELISTLVEGLNGQVNSHYSFELVDGRLVAKDGEPIEEMLLRALNKDIKTASNDPFFNFLPARSRAELDNFRYFQAQALGQESGNTLFEASVYTEEKDTNQENREKLIEAAQKPYWGRTMVRVSHWDGKRAHIITMSSDNLEATKSFGHDYASRSVPMFAQAAKRRLGYSYNANNSTDMLKEAVALNITDGSWKHLAAGVVGEVDKILANRHGGQWNQGHPAQESIDLQRYVESQTEIITGLRAAERRIASQFVNFNDYRSAFNSEIYNCLALLEKRLELGATDEQIVDYASASSGAGAIARAEGKTFDACGLIITNEDSGDSASSQSNPYESLERLKNKKIKCPECREQVVVSNEKLEAGRLCCSECKYELDVCTGKVLHKSQSKRKSVKPRSGLYDSAIAPIIRQKAEIDYSMEQRREARKKQEQTLLAVNTQKAA